MSSINNNNNAAAELTAKIAVLENVLDRMNRLEMPEQPLCDRNEIYKDIVAGMLLDCQTELIQNPAANICRPQLDDLEKYNEFWQRYFEFSSKTFGTPAERGCLGPLHHLKEEIQELILSPNDTMEWADCYLLLMDAARRNGFNTNDLLRFAEAKLTINQTRVWKKTENEVFKHI